MDREIDLPEASGQSEQEVAKEEEIVPVEQRRPAPKPKAKKVVVKKKRSSLTLLADSVSDLSSELRESKSHITSFEKKLGSSLGNLSIEIDLVKTHFTKGTAEAEKRQTAQFNKIIGSIRNYKSSLEKNAKLQIQGSKQKYSMPKKTKPGKTKKKK